MLCQIGSTRKVNTNGTYSRHIYVTKLGSQRRWKISWIAIPAHLSRCKCARVRACVLYTRGTVMLHGMKGCAWTHHFLLFFPLHFLLASSFLSGGQHPCSVLKTDEVTISQNDWLTRWVTLWNTTTQLTLSNILSDKIQRIDALSWETRNLHLSVLYLH